MILCVLGSPDTFSSSYSERSCVLLTLWGRLLKDSTSGAGSTSISRFSNLVKEPSSKDCLDSSILKGSESSADCFDWIRVRNMKSLRILEANWPK